MSDAVTVREVLQHQVNLFIAVVVILISMSLTLHIKVAHNTSNSENSCIGQKHRTITQTLCRADTSNCNAIIGLHQAITVELVLSCVRQILSITGHAAHLSTILLQADSKGICAICILVQIQSQSIHCLHGRLLTGNSNQLIATSNHVINHTEDIVEHLVLQSFAHKSSQSSNGLPAITTNLSERDVGFHLNVLPSGLDNLIMQVRLRHIAALSSFMSYQSVADSTTSLIVIILTDITTSKHSIQQLVRCIVGVVSHGAIDELSDLLIGVTLVNQLVNMCLTNLGNFLVLGIHGQIILSLLSNTINTTRLLHQLGHFNIQCHNSFPFSSRKIKEPSSKDDSLKFHVSYSRFFSQSSNSLCLGQHTDHNQLVAVVVHHTSKLKTRSTSGSDLPLAIDVDLQQLTDIGILCISSLVLVGAVQLASIQRNTLHQHTLLNLGDHLIIVIKISLACIDALGNKLMGNHLDALSGSCVRELNLTSLVVNLNTHTGDHSDLCGIVSGNILRAVHHQFTNHNIFPFSQMLLLTQIFPPCVTLASASGVILGFIQIQLDTLRLMYLRGLNLLFGRSLLRGFNTTLGNHALDAGLVQILNQTCVVATLGNFSFSNHLAGDCVLTQILLLLCKLCSRLFCLCLLSLILIRSQ
nr:MAG TPA: hypothetical protein [Caudoviricetes sp.]